MFLTVVNIGVYSEIQCYPSTILGAMTACSRYPIGWELGRTTGGLGAQYYNAVASSTASASDDEIILKLTDSDGGAVFDTQIEETNVNDSLNEAQTGEFQLVAVISATTVLTGLIIYLAVRVKYGKPSKKNSFNQSQAALQLGNSKHLQVEGDKTIIMMPDI